jgi:hypothetical protein
MVSHFSCLSFGVHYSRTQQRRESLVHNHRISFALQSRLTPGQRDSVLFEVAETRIQNAFNALDTRL